MAKMITVKAAAELLCVGKTTIRSMIQDGRLKAYRLPKSKKWLIDLDELKKFLS